MPTARALRVDEAGLLTVLDALLGVRRWDVSAEHVVATTLAPDVASAGAERIAASVLRFVLEGGGTRVRTVLRDGARARARPWESSVQSGLALRYGPASRALWLAVAEALPHASSVRAKPSRRLLRAFTVGPSPTLGDAVFFHLVARSAGEWGLRDDDVAAVRDALAERSAVARLLGVRGAGGREACAAAYGSLVVPASTWVLERLEDRVADAWTARARSLWAARRTDDARERAAGWSSLAAHVDGWLDAIDAAERMDLARPALTFGAALFDGPFAAPPEELWASLARSRGTDDLAARGALLGAVASVLAVLERLGGWRDRMAAERWGDPRWAEAQVYLGAYDATLGPLRARAAGSLRAVRGIIG